MGHYCYDTRHWIDDDVDPSITDWEGAARRDDMDQAGSWPVLVLSDALIATATATNGTPIPTDRRAE